MSGALRISRAMALALPLALTGALAAPSAARAVAPSDARQGFDIPAQDLRAALEAFDTATGISVLYGSDLAAGRRSSALRGRYAPDAALRLLLEGTGLIAQAVGDKAFVLRPAPSAIRRRGVGAGAASPGLRGAAAAARAGRPVPAAGQRAGRLPRGAGAAGRPARADRFGAPAGFHGQRGARRGDTRGLAGACRWASRPAIRARPTWCWCCRARAASRRTAPARPSLLRHGRE